MKRDYPERPIIAVGAVIVENDRFVLVRRGTEPHKGEWTIPGGMLECGESLHEAVIREAREETSLTVKPITLVEVFERIIRNEAGQVQFHYVIMDYLCQPLDGTLHPGEDAADARWLTHTELDTLQVTEGTIRVLNKALLVSQNSLSSRL
jgi:8-oxo-dGTP diphosphatase